MLTRSTPEDGDIVVREEQRGASLVYILHTAPGPDQVLLRSGEEAVAQALTLANRHQVRAWLTTDDGYDFVLLGTLFGAPRGDGETGQRVVADCERRLQSLLDRLHAEYLEMPGLRLTPPVAPTTFLAGCRA